MDKCLYKKQSAYLFLIREINMKENLVGNGFIFIPKDEIVASYLNRINVIGEIISADNFESEELLKILLKKK